MAQSTPSSNLGFQDFFSTTLSSAITASDTTIPLVSAPTPTEGFLVIEPDSSTNREIIMYTSKSGSSVVCGSVDDRGVGGTTARAHSSGAVVKMNTVSDMFEALQSGNGLSASFAIPAGVVKPEDLTSGTGTSWAWQSWTPTWSNVTIGNATVIGKYIQVGKKVTCFLYFKFGSTTSITASPIVFSLPVTAAGTGTYPTDSLSAACLGSATIVDAGTGYLDGVILLQSTTTATLRAKNAAGTYAAQNDTSSTVPMTWVTNDIFTATFEYEAA